MAKMTKELYEKLSMAGKALCEYCENDECSCCQVTRLMDDAYIEAVEGGLQMMPKKYEVAFVVYADIPEKDSSIGDLECNGTLRSYNCYSLRDARMYFTISAETPEEAYKKGLEKMQFGDADFGEAVVEDWYLENVSCGDKYWYKEDLAL